MAKYTCAGCRRPLPRRDARCRACGWAIDYDSASTRRARVTTLGVGLLVALIVASAFAIAYIELQP